MVPKADQSFSFRDRACQSSGVVSWSAGRGRGEAQPLYLCLQQLQLQELCGKGIPQLPDPSLPPLMFLLFPEELADVTPESALPGHLKLLLHQGLRPLKLHFM